MTLTEISRSLGDTENIAMQFLDFLRTAHSHHEALVVGLSGDLGSGKTTFTQVVAKILGIQETVTSPTFIIEKIYPLDSSNDFVKDLNIKSFIHIDAYRLEQPEELEKLGWQELISNSQNLIFIEWPEKVHTILPKDLKKIRFKFVDDISREISF